MFYDEKDEQMAMSKVEKAKERIEYLKELIQMEESFIAGIMDIKNDSDIYKSEDFDIGDVACRNVWTGCPGDQDEEEE
jgi:hypothetical protein